MCGRYSVSSPPAVIAERFAVSENRAGSWSPNHNVAPTEPVPAVVERDGVRRLGTLRWGLVPSWAGDVRLGAKLVNARAETVAVKPAFRAALARRRCLLPADGYYEWLAEPGRRKQPFFVRHRDGSGLAFAGLWEIWRDPADPAAEPVRSCAIVTTAANAALRRIHDRMPVVLPPTCWDEWLDPGRQDADGLCRLLGPAPAEAFEAYPVGTAVNDVRNKGPELLVPVPLESSLF